MESGKKKMTNKIDISGAHHLEPSTALYFCHGVFTDESTFSLNLPRTRTPHESTSTNQD